MGLGLSLYIRGRMGTLLELPLDVLGLILREIRTKRDLQTLCLVCSTFRTLATPRLYCSIDLTIEDAVLSPKRLRCLLDAKNDGVRFIKNLRIVGDWNHCEATKLYRSSHRMNMVNVLVVLLLQRIGRNQLQKFEWLLPSSISTDVIDQLQVHHPNLKKISWRHEPALNGLLRGVEPMRLPQLSSLSVQNVTTFDQMCYIQRWITSCNYLRKLEISTNWDALKSRIDSMWEGDEYESPVKCFFGGTIEKSECLEIKPQWSRIEQICSSIELVRSSGASQFSQFSHMSSEDGGVGLDDVCSIAERMEVVDHHPFDHRLQLDSLKLVEFPFLNSASLLSDAINLSRLTSLTLQACRQTDSLLDFWRQSPYNTINLKKLYLLIPPLQDEPPSYMSTISQNVNAVNKFIGSFMGLRSLILLSRLHTRYPMDEISRHSETLERLVIDLKTSPRARLYIKHARLVEIYRNYRSLVELGVSIQFTQSILSLLGLLSKKLTTLQILNTRKGEDTNTRLNDVTQIAKSCVTNNGGSLRIICMATSTDIPLPNHHTTTNIPRYPPHHSQNQIIHHAHHAPHTSAMQGGGAGDVGGPNGMGMDIGGDYSWGAQRKDVFYVQKAVNILGSNVPIITRIGMDMALELEGRRVGILKAGWGKFRYS